MGKTIGVGIAGCGNAARSIHLPLFRKHADLYRVVACADVDPARAEKFAAESGAAARPDVAGLVADPAVEMVAVLTKPPTTHRDVAVAALKAGKHVVVEKPMASTEAECDEMIAAASAAKRVLAVHHNRRWDVDFVAARYMVESGALGEMRLIRNEYSGGYAGSVYDWAVHIIDQTMALSRGKKFTELSAVFCKPNASSPLDSEGFFTCRLRTEDGVLHDMGMLPGYEGRGGHFPGTMQFRFFLAGTAGVSFQEWCQRPADAFGKMVRMQPAPGGTPLGDIPLFEGNVTAPDFYTLLHAAIRDGGPAPVTGEEGRRVVKAWELVCRSAVEKRTLAVSL